MYLLDTNVWIAFLNPGEPPIVDRIRLNKTKIFLCSVVKAELVFGAYKSSRTAENMRLLTALFSLFPSVSFDDRAAEHYGVLRAQLEQVGSPIGAFDLMIAAIAQANGLTVVTGNTKEFEVVPGLLIEDWFA